MAAERTLRRPKRPRAYALVIALAALVLAVGVAGTWSLAQRVDPTAGLEPRAKDPAP